MQSGALVAPKTILLAWELGGNLGHVVPLATIARRLSSPNCRIVWAVRDISAARIVLDAGATLFQAPVWPAHHYFGNDQGESSYLDLLVRVGFADPAKLGAVVAGWNSLIDFIRPDLVVADHSPGLMVALHGRALPVVTIGSGFTMPPLSLDRFPPILADRGPILPEARVLDAARQVLVSAGGAAPGDLVGLFRSSERVVFGFPEFDPYRSFRQEPMWLPPEPLPHFVDPPIEPHLFVYLGGEVSRLEGLVQTLIEGKITITAYLRGDAAAMAPFLRRRGHNVHERPPPLGEVLPAASHVLSTGGIFTCHAALAAGRPHLILPLHQEAELNLAMAEKLGVARRLPQEEVPGLQGTTLDGFLFDHNLVAAARHWARIVAARDQADGAAAVMAAVKRQLSSRDLPERQVSERTSSGV